MQDFFIIQILYILFFIMLLFFFFFFFSSRRRHTRSYGDWSSDVCSSDLSLPRGGNTMGIDIWPQDELGFRGQTRGERIMRRFALMLALALSAAAVLVGRSEERRVGKGCRSRGSAYHGKKNERVRKKE